MSDETKWFESLTSERLQADDAKNVLGQYKSQEDAHVALIEAKKALSSPFRLPESLDKLPDDNMRNKFKEGALKVLGIDPAMIHRDIVDKSEDLKDFKWTAGMPEGSQANTDLVNAFSQFIVSNKMPVGLAQKAVEFMNTLGVQLKARQDQQKLDSANATNEALIKHFGTKEKVTEQSELFKRAFKNHAGLNAEEYDKVADELVASGLNTHPVLARALLTLIAPLAKEGLTEAGEGGNPPPKSTEQSIEEELPNTAKALGWVKEKK